MGFNLKQNYNRNLLAHFFDDNHAILEVDNEEEKNHVCFYWINQSMVAFVFSFFFPTMVV
jgi:transcription initiation factor IIE alpha subunit